jgi:hypothetical protein
MAPRSAGRLTRPKRFESGSMFVIWSVIQVLLAHVPIATITKRIRRSTRASATRGPYLKPTPAFNSALP